MVAGWASQAELIYTTTQYSNFLHLWTEGHSAFLTSRTHITTSGAEKWLADIIFGGTGSEKKVACVQVCLMWGNSTVSIYVYEMPDELEWNPLLYWNCAVGQEKTLPAELDFHVFVYIDHRPKGTSSHMPFHCVRRTRHTNLCCQDLFVSHPRRKRKKKKSFVAFENCWASPYWTTLKFLPTHFHFCTHHSYLHY